MTNCIICQKPIPKGEEVKCKSCGSVMHDTCKVGCLECASPLCMVCSIDNEYKCTECSRTTEEGVQIEKVRRSYIDVYEKCPYGFYLSVVKGVQTPNNAYSSCGIILHDIFDRNSQGGFGPRVGGLQREDELLRAWDEEFKRIPHEEFVGCQTRLSIEAFKDACYEKGVSNIKNYIEWEKKRPDPWKTEENIIEWIDGDETLPKVSITMDRIDLINNEYEVLDYKTGKVFVGKNLASYLQTPLYIIMIEKHYGIKVARFRYLFFNEGKERVFERVDDDKFVCTVGKKEYEVSLQDCVRRVKSSFAKIRNNQFGIPGNVNNWYCKHMCGHGKSGNCQGAETQKWINANS